MFRIVSSRSSFHQLKMSTLVVGFFLFIFLRSGEYSMLALDWYVLLKNERGAKSCCRFTLISTFAVCLCIYGGDTGSGCEHVTFYQKHNLDFFRLHFWVNVLGRFCMLFRLFACSLVRSFANYLTFLLQSLHYTTHAAFLVLLSHLLIPHWIQLQQWEMQFSATKLKPNQLFSNKLEFASECNYGLLYEIWFV